MKRASLVILLTVLCLSQVHSQPSARKPNILVYPFQYSGDKNYSWISAGMNATIISDLGRMNNLSVFSDEDRRSAIKEIELGMSGLIKDGDAVRVGGIMGANLIFAGNIQMLGKAVRVTARLINVETAKTEKSIKLDGRIDEIFSLQDRVVLALIEEAGKIEINDAAMLTLDEATAGKSPKRKNRTPRPMPGTRRDSRCRTKTRKRR